MTVFVAHRVNTIASLGALPHELGAEIDIRASGSRLYLHHDPFVDGESLVDYLDAYHHGLLVLNIKEAGIEDEVLRLVRAREIEQFFLLDVEFPYLYRASRGGERAIAVRYSEDEPIELALRYVDRVDWVWIDTNTRLPLDAKTVQQLETTRTCLVCPSRWGRAGDIASYGVRMRELGFSPHAIMTSPERVEVWRSSLAG